MRNIENYVEKYTKAGFEDYKVLYRRKKILEVIEKYHSKKNFRNRLWNGAAISIC